MKPTNQTNLRGFLPLLLLILLFQSCNVYHKPSYSVDKAIEKQKKVKMLSKNMQTYEFEFLTKSGDSIIGHAKTKSSTAELLASNQLDTYKDGKMGRYYVDPNQVQEIKVKNGAASTGVKVGTGVGIAAIVLGAAAGFALIFLAFGA